MILDDWILEWLLMISSVSSRKSVILILILLTVPYRHDLRVSDSKINDEIKTLNRKLHKLVKFFSHISILEVPSRRCLHFEVVGGLEWSKDPECYAGSSEATGRVCLARQVDGDGPD
jgi:hypothetical protein